MKINKIQNRYHRPYFEPSSGEGEISGGKGERESDVTFGEAKQLGNEQHVFMLDSKPSKHVFV